MKKNINFLFAFLLLNTHFLFAQHEKEGMQLKPSEATKSEESSTRNTPNSSTTSFFTIAIYEWDNGDITLSPTRDGKGMDTKKDAKEKDSENPIITLLNKKITEGNMTIAAIFNYLTENKIRVTNTLSANEKETRKYTFICR